MPAISSYDYALIRVLPSVERGECINVGVLLFCRSRRYLGALIHLDPQRLLALAPGLDLDMLSRHLETLELICQGDPRGGPIALMSQSERFHWLVSPRSTIVQTSVVHCGLCSDPAAALQRLFKTMVYVAQ